MILVCVLKKDLLSKLGSEDSGETKPVDTLSSPAELYSLADEIASLEHLSLKGLMIMIPKCSSSEEVTEYFTQSYELFIDFCKNKMHNIEGSILSMGMSGDYKEALLCGANMIRPGRAIFGERI